MNELSLHAKIEAGKRRLYQLADRYGRTDARVLAWDQKLHQDIVALQRRQLCEAKTS